MRRALSIFLALLSGMILKAQNAPAPMEGTVTFVTSQSVYVKFENTQQIDKGDTLFIRQSDMMIPVLVVNERSSLSCVCKPISQRTLAVNDKVFHITKLENQPAINPPAPRPLPPADTIPLPPADTSNIPSATSYMPQATSTKPVQRISGFANIASYTNFSSATSTSERMKYTVSFNTRNIRGTGLSFESYAVFVHDNNNWSEIQKDLFTGLKVYDLAFSYDFGKRYSLLLGRKINPKLSNMGAVDGLQYEMRFKPLSVGLLAGFRPDTGNYGFNANLFQAGGYFYNEFSVKKSRFMTTLGFIDQWNHWKTDRQFIYFQHTNTIAGKINFYGAFDLDLYNQKYNSADSTFSKTGPKLTNLYLSLNYRIIRQLSVAFSYSARQNIIYYETYKNYLDKLLEESTLQGYMVQITARPVNRLIIGATGAYRFMKTDPRPMKNIYGYISYSQIPGVLITPTVSYTWLETAYLNGQIISAGITRDFAKGKLATGLSYRYIKYTFSYDTENLPQNLFEADITWRIIRKLSLMIYWEGTFEQVDNFNRIFAQINYRF